MSSPALTPPVIAPAEHRESMRSCSARLTRQRDEFSASALQVYIAICDRTSQTGARAVNIANTSLRQRRAQMAGQIEPGPKPTSRGSAQEREISDMPMRAAPPRLQTLRAL